MSTMGKKTWFPAKKYGWGWGLPTIWQGWVVLVAYGLLCLLSLYLFNLRTDTHWFLVYIFSITALLIAICWAKGEKPCWRWGSD